MWGCSEGLFSGLDCASRPLVESGRVFSHRQLQGSQKGLVSSWGPVTHSEKVYLEKLSHLTVVTEKLPSL